MSGYNPMDDLDEAENLADLRVRNLSNRESHVSHKVRPVQKPQDKNVVDETALVEQADTQDSFDFSYHASRHERQWIVDSLGEFYEQNEQRWLEDVLRLVKRGKEAHVYQCLADKSVTGIEQPYIAAKVFRPRRFRNLKNDHLYREGRQQLDSDGREVLDDRMLRAMQKKTSYGLDLLHTSWIEHEVKTMEILYAAGADVPKPLANANNAILMTYIGDEDTPAPTLNSVRLYKKEAHSLFERVIYNIELMLTHQRVHADLSAYNILYWDGKITLIDFPQAIDPNINSNAFRIFERDVTRVCEYFAHQGVKSNPRRLASDMWQRHGHRIIAEVHPALLDADDEGDRRLWRNQRQD
jgi:RIO kinase 1